MYLNLSLKMNPINFLGRGFRKFAGIFWKNTLNFDSNFKTNVTKNEFDTPDNPKNSILNFKEKPNFEDSRTGLMVQNINNIYKYFDPKRKSYLDKLNPNSINNRVCKVEISANNPSEDRCNALQLKNLNGYFLAVYDGHGGGSMAEYAKKELHKRFDDSYLQLKQDESILKKDKIVLALHKAFEEIVSIIN